MAEVKDTILEWVKKWQSPDGKPRAKQGLPSTELTPEELAAKQLEEEQKPTATQSQQLEWLKRSPPQQPTK